MKALVITTAAPDATTENQTGSTNWTLRLIRLLDRNHEVTLLAPPPHADPFLQQADFKQIECPPDDSSGKWARFIKSMRWQIYPSMWHQRSSKIDRFLARATHDSFDVCWLLDDYAGMYLRELPNGLPVVFCRHFVLNMGLVEENPSKHPLSILRLAWHRWGAKAFDKWTTQTADITITGTRESQRNLQELAGGRNVIYFPTKPSKIPPPVPEEIICTLTRSDKRIQVAYVGDMSFSRNAEGVQWFLSTALPFLSANLLKRFHFVFIGRQPPAEIMETPMPPEASLAFKGFVDDLETEIHQCQAAIIPVFGGNGVRIKTVTLLGAGLPTVSTPDSIEGLPVISGKDLIIAGTPETFAAGLRDLLSPERRRLLANKCRETMVHFLSEENDAEKLFSLSQEICQDN